MVSLEARRALSRACILALLLALCACSEAACPGRNVLTAPTGVIANAPFYQPDSTCEWLINATGVAPRATIVLDILSSQTECNYDYVFVFDGPSYASARQLVVLTGDGLTSSSASNPSPIVSTTGYMLVVLFSDPAYVRQGLNATYRILPCPDGCNAPSGAGTCVAGACVCNATYATPSCGISACPDGCNSDKGWGTCDSTLGACACVDGRGGLSCALAAPDASVGGWYSRRLGAPGRMAHSAVYMRQPSERAVVFGGYSISDGVLSDVAVFYFATGVTARFTGPVAPGQPWPSPSYGHAAAAVDPQGNGTGAVMFVCGGMGSNLQPTGAAWMLDTASMRWTRLADMPLNVSFHTATYVRGLGVVVYGGMSTFGAASSRMFLYDVAADAWSDMPQRGAVPTGVLAHVAVYHEGLGAIVVQGGGRWSLDGPRRDPFFYLYPLATGTWVHLSYPLGSVEGSPRARFLHSGVLWTHGNTSRLFVYGGLVHTYYTATGGDEECAAMDSFMYDFRTNAWAVVPAAHWLPPANYTAPPGVQLDPLLDQAFRAPSPRRFGAAALARDNGEIVVIGGYAGVTLSDVSALRMPPYDMGAACRVRAASTCINGDGLCGFCPSTGVCDSVGSAALRSCNATAPSGTGSVCAGLSTCLECTSVSVCGWCASSAQCFSLGQGAGCLSAVTNVSACAVSRLHNLTIDFGPLVAREMFTDLSDTANSISTVLGSPYFGTRARAVLRLGQGDAARTLEGSGSFNAMYGRWGERTRIVFVAPRAANFTFYVALDGLGALYVRTEAVATARLVSALAGMAGNTTRLWLAYYADSSVAIPEGVSSIATSVGDRFRGVAAPVSLARGEKAVIEVLRLSAGPNTYMALGWTFSAGGQPSDLVVANGSVVMAYANPAPSQLCPMIRNCRACVADAACAWCGGFSGSCTARADPACAVPVATDEATCPSCLTLSGGGCEECLSVPDCEWQTSSWRCDDVSTAVVNTYPDYVVRGAPSQCGNRYACTPQTSAGCGSCVNTLGCMWCETFSGSGVCAPYDAYESTLFAGMCSRWAVNGIACPSCEARADCASCSQLRGCGWLYDPADPRVGSCIRGDFAGPSNTSATSGTGLAYAYSRCPDIDECALGLSNCHRRADCTNTDGGYVCTCRAGYSGNGRTCEPVCTSCVHGVCGAPEVCLCDLGYTGLACDVDCLCHGNSDCHLVGPGTCDRCERNTTGLACDQCLPGFFGNATGGACQPCNCNGHGDPLRGYCNPKTGECECVEGYAGLTCALCQSNYVGSGANGGVCYSVCAGRKVLTAQSGGIGTVGSMYAANTVCQWLIAPSGAGSIRLSAQRFSTECGYDFLYVYDGDSTRAPLIAAASGPSNAQREYVTSGPVALVVFYSDTDYTLDGFSVSYEALSCPSNCWSALGQGVCNSTTKTCVCSPLFGGPACDKPLCPGGCNAAAGRGRCVPSVGCVCAHGFAGPSCSLNVTDGAWFVATPHALSPARGAHTAVLVPGPPERIVVYGGYSLQYGALSDLVELNIDTGMWTNYGPQTGASAPGARAQHTAVVIRGRMYVYGGLLAGKASATDNRVYTLDLATRAWSIFPTQGSVPALAGHAAFASGDNMYVVGGFLPTIGLTTRASELNTQLGIWRRLYPSGYPSMFSYSAAVGYDPVHRVAYVYGGVRAAGSAMATKVTNALFRFELPQSSGDNGRWGTVVSSGAPLRAMGALAYVPPGPGRPRDYFVAFGGSSFDHNSPSSTTCYSSDLSLFDSRCEKFFPATSASVLAPVVSQASLGRHSHAMVVGSNSTLYVVGGFNGASRGDVLAMRMPTTTCALSLSACSTVCDSIDVSCSSLYSCPDCASYFGRKNCQWCDNQCREVTAATPPTTTCRSSCSECQGRYGCVDCMDNSGYLSGIPPACAWTYSVGSYCSATNNPSDISRCPTPCPTRKDCATCEANGPCAWCESLNACLDLTVYTAAQGMGQCTAYKADASECSVDCSQARTCETCFDIGPHCGWCADNSTGRGQCVRGDFGGPSAPFSCPANTAWKYGSCPDRDECALGTSLCDPVSTVCVNTQGSYRCKCKDGYRQTGASSVSCQPICTRDCIKGTCVAPEVCVCNLGYYGADCSRDCGCNGHSNCTLGPGICDKCMGNTIGDHCEFCAPHSFGNATNGGTCTSCLVKCNGNSDTCQPMTGECYNCRNNTYGASCDLCNPGFTRNSAPTPGTCVPCDCNGHASSCDSVTGTCGCTFESRTTGKDCSKCMQGYAGNPVDGRECYLIIGKGDLGSSYSVDGGEVRYFVVRPHYTNVDMRVTIDVVSGSVTTLLTPRDDEDALAADAIVGGRVDRKQDLVVHYRDYNLLSQMFYLSVRAEGPAEYYVYYSQNVAQIDLFVFFSVFFSCFFLFLSVIIMLWRFKTRYDRHLAVVRRGVELQSMARRPMGQVTVILSDSLERPHVTRYSNTPWATVSAFLVGASPDPFEAYRAASTTIVPASLQFTADGRCAVASVLVELPAPGLGSARPLSVGTTLMSVSPVTMALWDSRREEEQAAAAESDDGPRPDPEVGVDGGAQQRPGVAAAPSATSNEPSAANVSTGAASVVSDAVAPVHVQPSIAGSEDTVGTEIVQVDSL